MLNSAFRAEIGPYWLLLPAHAKITAEVSGASPGNYQMALTRWVVEIGRFRLFIHLDPIKTLTDLKSFVDLTTKSDVSTEPMVVNGVSGMQYGGYGAPRTWIDWWFLKGDVMLCMCLQAASASFTEPTEKEAAEHRAILESLKYCRDFSSELPPTG